MKKTIAIILTVLLVLSCFAGCGETKAPASSVPAVSEPASEPAVSSVPEDAEPETYVFTDSCGREVEIPTKLERVAPSGAVAQMILATIIPDLMVGVANDIDEAKLKFFPDNFADLPAFGQMYGSKANLNMEALIAAEPQLVIDLGDMKDSHADDMTALQEQIGIPTVYVNTTLENLAEAYRTLGEMFDRAERGEELAQFVERTLTMAEENSAKIAADDVISVMYAAGTAGQNAIAKGSIQGPVIEYVGAENAVVLEDVTGSGNGNELSLEQIYNFDPDVIIIGSEEGYKAITEGAEWKNLTAVSAGKVYLIPNTPYNWMSNPPSYNMIFGVWWLGNLLYPETYDYDMVEIAQEFYSLFFDYELTDAEAQEMLALSTLKPAE